MRERKYAECPVCGNTFHKRRSSSTYCSTQCQHKSREKKVSLKCDECGEIFEKHFCHVRKHNFCSKQCYFEWQRKNSKGENSNAWKNGLVNHCGYEFQFVQSDGNAGKRYRATHRLVMEKSLGRRLTRDEIVHHKD